MAARRLREVSAAWLSRYQDTSGFRNLGMISNRGYFSGPTFRGMRCFIWQRSSTLHIMDLHGGALQKCRPPGVTDENVFDIKQGVAIILAGRTLKPSSNPRTSSAYEGRSTPNPSLLAEHSALSEGQLKHLLFRHARFHSQFQCQLGPRIFRVCRD